MKLRLLLELKAREQFIWNLTSHHWSIGYYLDISDREKAILSLEILKALVSKETERMDIWNSNPCRKKVRSNSTKPKPNNTP